MQIIRLSLASKSSTKCMNEENRIVEKIEALNHPAIHP